MSGDTTAITPYQACLDFIDLVLMEQDAWADLVSNVRSQEYMPESSTVAIEEVRQNDPSMSHPSEASTNEIEDDEEEFGEFQSASTDPSKQPIYDVVPDDDNSTLLSHPDPEQTGIFTGFGLVQPLHAHRDVSTKGLRRAGKLMLRKLQIKRENERLNLHNVTVMTGPRHVELRELARALAQEKTGVRRGDEPGGYRRRCASYHFWACWGSARGVGWDGGGGDEGLE